ncbi:MAG: hypothetical protein K2H46_01475 [Muribaculaceae bacterium]|nr:hypothetical protein [Muribaculaceae bacterium]
METNRLLVIEKNKLIIFFSFIIIICGGLPVLAAPAAPAAQFKSICLRHNVNYSGVKNLEIIMDVTVHNLKGYDISFNAYIETPKGVGHKDTNQRYCTRDGKVSTSKKVKSIYDHCEWEELILHLPNSEIHPLPGKNTYYIQVLAYYDGKCIGRSDYVSFNMEGDSQSLGSRQSVRKDNGYDEAKTDMKIDCVLCHRTGKCGICGGLGYTVPMYGYSKGQCVPCSNCTDGKCRACLGKGYSIVQSRNGNVYVDGRYVPPASGSSGGSSTSSKTGCSKCGGTGVNKTPNSGGSLQSWVAYYNSNGSKCPYCFRYTSHYHDRCPSCNVPNR